MIGSGFEWRFVHSLAGSGQSRGDFSVTGSEVNLL